MDLYCETILDFYKFKNRTVLCQIKVNPKCRKLKNSCRSLSEEQWISFDKELEKLLIAKDYLNNEKCIKFNIKPSIEVEVQKSKLSCKHFFNLFDEIGGRNKDDAANVIEHNLVLECIIDYQLEVPLSSLAESQEYEPQIDTSSDGKLCSQLQYEPYTPTKKIRDKYKVDIIKNIGIDILKDIKDTYSPKPIFEISPLELNGTQAVPKYIPAPINTRAGSKERNKFNIRNEEINKTDGQFSHSDKHKSLRKKLRKKSKRIECEYIPKSQELIRVNVPVYIPTPIQGTTPQNVHKTYNIRQNKRRSNTIDVFPERLNENITEVPELLKIKQLISEDKHPNCDTKNLKKRSMSIDEIPAALADVPVLIPTLKEETTLPELLITCKFIRNKKTTSSKDAMPEILGKNTKENHLSDKEEVESKKKYYHCEKRNLKNRFMTIDENPVALEESNMLNKSKEKLQYLTEKYSEVEEKNTSLENKREKLLKMSSPYEDEFTTSLTKNLKRSSKTQTFGSDVKLENADKINKNIKIDAHPQKVAKKYEKIEASSTETTKSFRRSQRSPSKPKRLIEEQPSVVNKNSCKKHKSSPKNKELFGTDDDDEDYEHCIENKNDSKANSTFCENVVRKKFSQCNSTSSTKRHLKMDKSGENDMCKSLSQKKITQLNIEATKSLKASNNSRSSKSSSLMTSTKFNPQMVYSDDPKFISPTPITFKLLSIEEKGNCER